MSIKRLPHSGYKIMPWQNGLGVTAEIDRVPGGDGAYLWRLSQATIQTDSPFSVFKGFDRWLAVWRGNAILLNDLQFKPLMPVRFSGDENTFCRVADGPVQDVGLIFDRAKVNAEMKIVEGSISLAPAHVHYIFDLESGDTLKADQAVQLSVPRSFLISIWNR